MAGKVATADIIMLPPRLIWASAVLWVPFALWWLARWIKVTTGSEFSEWVVAGGLLQCLAVGLALREASVLRRKFGYESIWQIARQFLFPIRKRSEAVFGGIAASLDGISAAGKVSTAPLPIDQRVSNLEVKHIELRKDLGDFKNTISEDMAAARRDLSKMADTLRGRIITNEMKGEDAHRSTFVHSIIGLVWILTGALMSLVPAVQ